jgi:hypothetical protein
MPLAPTKTDEGTATEDQESSDAQPQNPVSVRIRRLRRRYTGDNRLLRRRECRIGR